MARLEVNLEHGLKVDDVFHKKVTLRESTYGDLIDAQVESERIVPTGNGYEAVTSPTLVAVNVLRRQIVSIGEISGPISLAEMKKLSLLDSQLLQVEADKLDQASLGVALQRGRDQSDAGGSGESGADSGTTDTHDNK